MVSQITTHILEGFDDPIFGRTQWDRLLDETNTNFISLTWLCQRMSWERHRRGDLLLIAVKRDGRFVALAPFYAHENTVFFVATDNSDYVDFIGDIGDPEVLDAILQAALH